MRCSAALVVACLLLAGCTYSSSNRAQELASATPTPPPTEAPEPTPAAGTDTAEGDGSGGDAGADDVDDGADADDVAPGWVVVEGVDEFLNVRSGPGVAFDVIGRADLGVTLPTTGGRETVGASQWVEVELEDDVGWVAGNFVADTVRPTPTPVATPTPLATPTPAAQEGDLVVDAPPGLNMRRRPTTDANVIRELDDGTIVTPTGETRERDGLSWTEIQAGDDVGWVVTDFLEPA